MFKWFRRIMPWSQQYVGQQFIPQPVLANVTVNENSALTISAVWCAVRVISETLASLPLILYKRLPEGGKDKAEEHPLSNLLKEPNAETTGFVLRETLLLQTLVTGNSYLEIVRNQAGQPIELWLIPHEQVSVTRENG